MFSFCFSRRNVGKDFIIGIIAGACVRAQFVRIRDNRHFSAQRIVHIHKRANTAEYGSRFFKLFGVSGFAEFFCNSGCTRHNDGHLQFAAEFFQTLGPRFKLCKRQVRTADKAKLRLCSRVFPNARIRRPYAFEFRIVYDIFFTLLVDYSQ